ncbi:Alpha/Beta hydrolase protein [Podospora didyma]|uniref:Alpha/Beta hydrolase protein n=1 Tax=Podospora didyma TaxID=330526 RepID=A0AAE0NQG1_9PEZI|nr:Alpha/Beta hydrolase protein [Podospora didyma]
MDTEKHPLIRRRRSSESVRRRDRRVSFRHFHYPWKTAAALIIILGTFLCYQLAILKPHGDSFDSGRTGYRTYDGEKISWKLCGTVAERDLECSRIDVPMDQFNASNNGPHGNMSFSLPLVRLRGKNATQSVLLNPGGPGGSGSEFIHRRGAQLSQIVGEGFHLLTFDPRGVNESIPVASCYPTPEARQQLSSVRSKKIPDDSGELYAWTSGFVQSCAKSLGEHGKYINTPQTAADMNSILDAIGQPDMYYWGFSYGTLLGQTYATLFPERSKRVIIDGVANQYDWYDGLLDKEELTDTDRVFSGFVDECMKAGPDKCALASLANSKEELHSKLLTSIDKLRDDPIGVYVNNTLFGVLDYWAVWYEGVFPALYRPANWYTLANNLASLLRGNATDAFLAYNRPESDFNTTGKDTQFVITLNDGASGPKHWPKQGRTDLLDIIVPFFDNSSSFAGTSYDFYFAKQAWPIEKTHGYVPRRGVQTAHPLLILTTTYDPVCPLVSAKSAYASFEDSRIVEVLGYGHCSVAVPSVCLAKHVRNFFYEGLVPDAAHTRCEVDGEPYFVKPAVAADGKVCATVLFDDPEEQEIHLAQLELARDSWLRPW